MCRPDRWADAPYQYIADQKQLEFTFELEGSAKVVTVAQRTDALKQTGAFLTHSHLSNR